MDRRTFVAGSAVTLVATRLAAYAELSTAPETAPEPRLFEKTFGPLLGSLAFGTQWHRYPAAGERGWRELPDDIRAAMVKRADAALVGEWPPITDELMLQFKETGNRASYEAVNFGRRIRVNDLVLGECVAGSGTYLDAILHGLDLICTEKFWGSVAHLAQQKGGVGLPNPDDPIVDLFAAETAATLAWITRLLGTQLDRQKPGTTARIQKETERRVLQVYLHRDHGWLGLNGKPHRLNNWNPWINSNLLTAALLLEKDPATRQQILLRACRSLDAYLQDVSPDGGCEEGPSYWGRSAASLLDCGETLISASGGKGEQIFRTGYMRAAAHYIADVHIAGNDYVDYGDAHTNSAPAPDLLYRFGKRTGDETLIAFGAYEAKRNGLNSGHNLSGALAEPGGLGSLSRELAAIFSAPAMRNVSGHDALTRDSDYPVLGLMTARETEGASEGFYIALQAASNGRSHGHNDSGSFLTYFNGKPVFIDVGVGQYTKQTFSADRYKIWTMQSAFHNLPIVGGVEQQNAGKYCAKTIAYKSGTVSSIAVDLAPAYPPEVGIKTWKRTLALDRTQHAVTLRESFALTQAVPVQLVLMCAVEPVVSAQTVRVGDVVLGFDGSALSAKAEPIDLTDAPLEHAWGKAVWRLLLSSKGEVAEGDWRLTLKQA